ncbi:MAG: alpha/beta fold hydrolase [Conexibacter sp.]|nr:alpha/beta fold hydrolase [Conexibacter sp.]
MRLRLWHAPDGARIAYRETGTGPPLVLVHSAGFSHREFEPAVEGLAHRFRLVLPDLPAHGDSEDRPRHPYTFDWLAEVLAAFCTDVAGRRPLVGGHGLGGDLLIRAVELGLLSPTRMALLPCRLHRPPERPKAQGAWLAAARAAGMPGLDRLAGHAVRLAFRPERGVALTARAVPEAQDLVRHAMADIGGNANLARSWARLGRHLPRGPRREVLDLLPQLDLPVLLLWADEDRHHPLRGAEEALDLLPDAILRVLPGTGYLIAYDDPVGVARELIAFFG